jgi:hypothetical protein
MKNATILFFATILILTSCTNRDSEIIELLNAIKQHNEDLKSQLTTVKKTADSALTAANAINASLSTTNKNISTIQADLKSVITQIANLTAQMTQTNADLTLIKSKLDALQTKCEQLIALLGTQYSVSLSTGLIAYYPFNGNANDVSGNSNNGIPSSGLILTSDRNNISNSAYYFNGQSNIEVLNSSSLNSSDVTISVWYNSEIKNATIIAKSNKLNALEFSYKLTHEDEFQGQKGLLYSYGLGNCNSYSNAYERWQVKGAIKENTWNHLVFSINRDGIGYVYLNGEKIATINDGIKYNPCNLTNATLRIGGKHWNSDPELFKGKIDDVGIWNRTLSADEIKFLYQNNFSPI